MTVSLKRHVGDADDTTLESFGVLVDVEPRFEPKGKRRREYWEYLRSPHWKETRARVLARDDERCCDCGSKKRLSVHHLTYERLGAERLDDLTTLCKKCHAKRHGM